MTHTFPTLFKKTSTGAIQWWTIMVEPGIGVSDEGVIVTQYGQVGTDKPQETRDRVSKGKNIGKVNATTPYDQAVAEAAAKHEKQRKKGYVVTAEAAEAGEVDAVVAGGIVPMLAHKFSDHADKIKFPAYGQPKLDGVRCIAIVQDGKCTLWSRQRNPITSSPHICAEIEKRFPTGSHMLDGELYNHDMKSDFEKLVSLIRQETPHRDCELIQYHTYDVPYPALSWEQRDLILAGYYTDWDQPFNHLKLVMTFLIQFETDVPDVLENMRLSGYEGLMLRNTHGLYANKRSYDLQKVKQFDDDEFVVIGIEEGRGRLQGHVGAFVCRTRDGAEFLAKMSGTTERLREYWDNHHLWQGKMLTVRYQGLTGKTSVPRFPVGVALRNYE